MLESCRKIWRSLHTIAWGARAPRYNFNGLEEFVCYLCGVTKSKDINNVQKYLMRSYWGTTKLQIYPRYLLVVKSYNAWRTNAIACIWQHLTSLIIELPTLKDNGRTNEREIYWMDDAFPDDVAYLLFNNENEDKDEEDDQYFCGSDTVSSDEKELTL